MDIPEPVKKYWPYLLGGAVGIYVIAKMSGAGSASPSSVVLPGYDQNAALANSTLAAQSSLANATLAANTENANNLAQIEFLKTQGIVAGQLGTTASQMITALQMPTIAAINSGNVADAAALESAGNVAIAGFNAQANINRSSAITITSLADAVRTSMSSISNAVSSVSGGTTSAVANANAKNSGDMWGGLGTLATFI